MKMDLIADSGKFALFDKCCSRVVLLILNKQKAGREQKTYDSIADIECAFCIEHAEKVAASCSSSSSTTTTSPPQEACASADHAAPATLSQASDARWVANQKGFKEGKHYTH